MLVLMMMMSTMKIFRARDTVNDLRPGEGAVLAENGKVCRSKCLVVGVMVDWWCSPSWASRRRRSVGVGPTDDLPASFLGMRIF